MVFYHYYGIADWGRGEVFEGLRKNAEEFCRVNERGDRFTRYGQDYTLTQCTKVGEDTYIEIRHEAYGGLATFEVHGNRKKIEITQSDFPGSAPSIFEDIIGVPFTSEDVPCIEVESGLWCPQTTPAIVVGRGRQIEKPKKIKGLVI